MTENQEFLDVDAMVADMIANHLNDEDTNRAIAAGFEPNPSEDQAARFACRYGRIELGRYIRNTYRLWDPDNPQVAGKHPDDLSAEVIERIRTHLSQVHPDQTYAPTLEN